MISKRFIEAIRLHPERNYVLAHRAGIHPATLSKFINGIVLPKDFDPRVIEVGKLLGLSPEECFEISEEKLTETLT